MGRRRRKPDKPDAQPRGQFAVEELERRILLSTLTGVDPDSDAWEPVEHPAPIEQDVGDPDSKADGADSEASALNATAERRLELVFVDTGVEGYEALVDDLRSSSSDGRSLEVFLLDAERDGIEQISDILADYEGVDAIHIVSHGSDGAVQLGNTWLQSDSLVLYSSDVAGWGEALGADADLLFYGCNLAGGESGEALVDSIAKLTGADVAASNDLTGAEALAGDWDLEYQAGSIESDTAVGARAQQSYLGVLANTAPIDLQTTTTTGGGLSLNEDAGNDVYFVADDGGGLLGGLNTVTIETTFSISTPATDVTPLLSYADGAHDEELALFIKNDGRIWFMADSAGAPYQSTTGSYNQLFDGEPHHVAVSWDSGSGAVVFYVDGALAESFTGYQTGSTITGTGELVFGQDQDSVLGGFRTIDIFSGVLYDVRIFDDVRTAGEISANYDATLPPTEPGMIANWNFGNLTTSGIVAEAVSGNNLTEQHVVAAGFSASVPELTLSVAEDAPNLTVIGSLIAIDPDAGDTFTYTLLDNAGGRFAIDGSTGEIAVADASLIDYETANSHDITARVTDAGGLTYDETFAIAVNPVNDAPVAVGESFVAVEGVPFAAGLGFDDLLMNDSDIEGDALSVNTTPVSGPANGSLVLYADGTFLYTPNHNFNGTDSFIYEVLDGNGGSAQATATFTVQPREIRILFTTAADVNSSRVPGIDSWDAGDVLAIGDPNLSFEPVGSDGSILPQMDLESFAASADMTINGLHFVSNDLTVGGANSVDLQRGDLLFVSGADDVMTSLNSLAIGVGDVIVFRPNAVDDYSSGTFIHLLDQPGTEMTTGITLIEKDVLVGDVTLQAGTFLFTQESVVEESSIFHFSADDVGAGTTTGTVSTLISSVDIGVNWNNFVGVMVISEDLYLDGTTVSAGSIVTTLSGGDESVGSNGILVNEDEIFYFTVTSTTMGSGTTAADATVLFDGGDIGLNNANKKMRSLAIIEEIQAAPNVDPSITLPSGPINYTEQDPPTLLDPAATLVDPDSSDFDGGLLRVDLETTGSLNDRLAIRNEGTAAGQVGVSGSDVTYGVVVIGTFSGGSDGTDPLTVLFNANADVTAVQAVLRNITYENVSNDPSTNQRAAKFTLTDGDSGVSDPVVKIIVVNDVNAAPVISGANDLAGINEDAFTNGGTLVSDLIAGWVTDADPGALAGIAVVGVDDTNGTWEFSTDGGAAWTAFGSPSVDAARLLAADAASFVRFVPDADWNGTVTDGITFHAWDQTSGASGAAVDLVFSGTLRDEFGTVSYGNNDGTMAWTSDWVEFNDNGSAASGQLRVESGELHLDNQDLGTPESIARSADLSTAATATLTFDYDAYGYGGLDTAAFEVSNDGGATWTLLESMDFVGNLSGSKSYTLDSYTTLTANMQVRFRIALGFGGPDQQITVDNVQIAYSGTGTGVSSSVSAATASSSITVAPVNDAPVRTAGTVADLTVAEDSGLTSLGLAGLGYGPGGGADEASQTLSYEVTVIPDPSTFGKIYLADGTTEVTTGFYSLTDLQGMQFEPAPDEAGGPSFFGFRVIDSGGTPNGGADTLTETIRIDITPVNDAPVLSLPGGPVNFTEGDGATIIDAAASLTDPDSVDFDGGVLTVDFTAGSTANDRLGIESVGGAGSISLTGSDVEYDFGGGPVAIGTLSGGTDGTTPLVITLNANADAVAVEALLASITYDNVSVAPSTADRTVRFVLSDGDGGTSDAVTEIITVSQVNDPPDLAMSNTPLAYTENDGPIPLDTGLTLADLDSSDFVGATVSITTGFVTGEDFLAFSDQLGITGAYDAATGILTLTGTASVADYETALRSVSYENTSESPNVTQRSVTVVVDDGFDSGTDFRRITIASVNDAPTISLINTTTNFPENTDTTVRIKVADIVVSDDDLGTNDLTLTGTDAGLFEIDTGVLYLKAGATLDFELNPVLDVTVVLDDAALPATPEDSEVLAITVTDVNEAPTLALTNVTTTFPEDTSTASRVKVADITITDDAIGTNMLSLSGTDAGLFEIDAGVLYLKAGSALDFETNPVLDVTVAVDDAALPATPEDSQALAITVTDVNEAPTLALTNVTTTFPENTDTTSRVKVADITITDDALGTNVLSLTGTDAGLFEIDTGVLYLKAGTALDFELNPVLDVTVVLDDAALPATPEDSEVLAITVTDVNEAPTLTLTNVTTTFPEDTSTASRVKVADITITDDALGTNVLSLSGTDAALFEIDTGVLYLKAGATLDFETNPVLDVTVVLDDAALPATPEDSEVLAITVTDVNEAPTLTLTNVTTTFPEDTSTASRVKVADITITDDALGTNVLSLSGTDAALFEIDTGVLYLKAGTALDFELNPVLDVTVVLDDAALPATPEDSEVLAITVTDVNEAPTLTLTNVTTTFPEDTSTASRVKVADITITDDALGTNVLSLTGTDAGLFEIDTGVLYLKAGTVLDLETNPVLDVTVVLDDAALPATPEDSEVLAITVTDVNEAPTLTLTNVTTTFPEDTSTASRVKVADITITDDALGTNVLSLTGTDASLFEIDAGVLYLKAGTALDFELNPVLDVTVVLDDAALPATPEDSEVLAITVTDVNEAPTLTLTNVTTTFPEDTSTASRVKVADITITDDALGTNVLSLTGTDAGLFEIDTGVLYLKAGTALDFELNPVLDVTVVLDDAALPATPEDSEVLAITVTDVNEAPTLTLTNVTTTFPEDTSTASRVKVADITVTDDALGTNVLSLTGTDAGLFEIDAGVLYLKAGTALDFELNPVLDVTVVLDDAALPATPEDSEVLAITVTDVNEAPTLTLTNVTTTFPEDTSTASRVKVADITVTDDALGTNVLSLTGTDAGLFEIDAGVLYLKAGTALDFELNPVLDVTVVLDDAALPATPEDSEVLAITVTDVNEAPTLTLTNVTTTFPEDTSTASRVKVADITITDDALGTNVLSLTGTDAGLFEIDTGVLYLKAGTVLDLETNPVLDVTVVLDDAALPATPEDSEVLAITVTDVNEAPTLTLTNVTTTFPEDTSTASRVKVADITITDDALGTNVLSLTGTDAGLFEIDAGVLYLKAGSTLDFETNPVLDVTVAVDDAALPATPEDSEVLAITVTDVNEAPTLTLTNVTTTFPEDTSTASRVKVADITITDDALGTNVLSLTGTDAALFEIDTGVLYLKAGTVLDLETNPVLDVTVVLDDAALPATPEDSEVLAITVTDVNEAPTLTLTNVTTTFPEDTSTASRIHIADISITDDALGTNVLSLTGTDAGLFEIDTGVLYLKAGTVLDLETNPVLDVTVVLDDAALPATPEDSEVLAITVTDVNEAPTLTLTNVTTTFPEDTSTASRVKVADITITDDALGTNVLSLTGTDAGLFEIDAGVLYLKAGTALDFELNPVLDVTVVLDDAALPATPEDSEVLAITVTDVNEAPTLTLTNVTTTFPEDTSTASRIHIADITITDDALGTNVLSLSGTDAALFEIDTGVLYLKAGATLDFETNPVLDVTVVLDDAALPATPEDSEVLAITVTDVNEAPTLALTNVTTTFPEDTSTASRVKVADITVTDDALGTNVLSLTGTDAGLFEIDTGVLYLKAGATLDFELNPVLDVTVVLDDAALPATPEDSEVLAITVTDVNEAPTLTLTNVTTTFPEDTSTASRIHIADITITDDALGTNVLSLSGTDAALFEIDTGVLYLKAGTVLDLETNPILDVTVALDDAALPATPEDSQALAITVTDVNEAPTLSLTNVTTTFPENTDTTARIKVADITITDDALGTNVLSLSGTDSSLFEIDTGVLYLKAGATLDFETNPVLDVTVVLDDAALPATPEDSEVLAITVTDVNEAPTLTLTNVTTTFPENTDTTARIKVADITITDDALGTNVLSLSGTDSGLFEIDAGVLYLKAGSALDFETNPVLDVTVVLDDAALPATPEDSQALAITVTDVNEAPTLSLTNVTTTFPENTDTTARIKVADITITDDALGTNVLSLSGTDSSLFEIDAGVLYLKAGSALDFETNPVLDVTVVLDDAALPATPEDSQALAITVTDVNEAPTLTLTNVTTTFPEDTSTASRVKVADITITDDALGTNVLSLTGTDSGLFEIDAGVLYLKAGSALDFETNPVLDVTIAVDDAALPATPEDSQALAITVTDVNEAPTLSLTNVTTTFPENTDTTARIKVADITITDDALGTNVLSLTGTDAGLFEIDTGVLYLKAGTALDFETTPILDVTVELDDAALPATPEDSEVLAITVTNVNEAPVIDLDADDSAGETLSDFAMAWTEGGGPVVIADIDATLLDVDSAMLGSLNVAISNLLDSGFELLSADTSGTNITATYDSALGVLELSGTDSVANYEQVLRTITYDNQSHTPAVSDRSIEFFASDGLSFSNVATATVSVTPTDDAPVLENNRLTISEGDTVGLTASDLSASDVDSDPSSLGFSVTNIEHGRFERLGAPGTAITSFDQADIANGQVRFVHDGSEFAPSYQVTVSDASSNVGPALVTVTFTNVNDAPVSVGDSYLGSEDSVLTTSADDGVLVGDSDEEAQPLVAILVSGPSSAANFTLNSDGSFDYTPMQDFFGADSFSYRASDGEAASGIATVTITVSPVNDMPELLNNRLSVAPGDVVALTTENLGAADVDHAAADLEFDVAAVENGHFERAGEPDQSITNFAQSEVAAGEIYFVHDGSLFAPSYEVMVSDGDLTAGPYLADVTFNTFADQDSFDPDPDEPPPIDPQPEPAPEPPPEDEPLPDGEEEPAPDPEEPQPEDGFRRVTWFPAGSSKDPTFERAYDELPTLERSTAMLEAPEDDDSLSKRLGDHEQAEASRMLALSDLWRVLEQMRTDMEQSGEEDAAETETLVAAAEGLSLAFSSGLLLLLMRSGSLWAVALSALPVWRRVDPLAVLAITAEERRKLERDLRRAEQQEDTAGLGLGRVLDSTEEDEEPDEKEEAGRSVGALERERPDERA